MLVVLSYSDTKCGQISTLGVIPRLSLECVNVF